MDLRVPPVLCADGVVVVSSVDAVFPVSAHGKPVGITATVQASISAGFARTSTALIRFRLFASLNQRSTSIERL